MNMQNIMAKGLNTDQGVALNIQEIVFFPLVRLSPAISVTVVLIEDLIRVLLCECAGRINNSVASSI